MPKKNNNQQCNKTKEIGQSYEHCINCSFDGLLQTNTHNTITSHDWDNVFKLIFYYRA